MVTTQALTSQESAFSNSSRPCFCGFNVLTQATDEHWSANRGSFAAASALEQTPVRLARDLKGDPATAPDSNSGADVPTYWSLAWELPVNSYVVDCVSLFGLNFKTIQPTVGNITVTLDGADDNAFTTGVTNFATWNVTTDDVERLASFFSSAAVGCRYWRLEFEHSTNWPSGLGLLPAVGEVFLGKRRQLSFGFNRPYDRNAVETVEQINEYPGGKLLGTSEIVDRGFWSVQLKSREDDYGVDQTDTLHKWLNDSNNGGPSIFWPRTDEDEKPRLVRQRERRRFLPEVGPAIDEASFNLVEQPPFYVAENKTGVGV